MRVCSVPDCGQKHLVRGFCNGHYLRFRKGKDLTTSIKPRRKTCEKCNKKHYGHGLCQAHYNKKRRLERWEYFIKYKGGKCQKCSGVFHPSVYDFHHRNPKEKDIAIGNSIADATLERLTKEIDKCDLLCANCHRETHFGEV